MNAAYIVQSILVPNIKGVGEKRARAEATRIEGKEPIKTTLEGTYWHNRFYHPDTVKKAGYTRYVSKKLPSGVILTLAYRSNTI